MGILNVTPDSFSDGGRFMSEQAIAKGAEQIIKAGADIIDVGGESTRPFASPVLVDEELGRVIPAVKAIRRISNIPISIDTTKSRVAEQALDAGADIVNDISAMRFDPNMTHVVRDRQCPVVIMHMQGTPEDMQIKPSYSDVISETIAFFRERLTSLADQGIDPKKIIIDPGIGFGKSLAHNLAILKNTSAYQVLNCPILIGHSRKSFLCALLGQDLEERDQPTAVISGLLAQRQVSIIRVHDVKKTRQALRLAEAIACA